MNGVGDLLFVSSLIVCLFIWYIFKILQIQATGEKRMSDNCGFIKNRIMIEHCEEYFKKVLKRSRPTVGDCLDCDEFLQYWLISKNYDVSEPNQCILERHYSSLYGVLSHFLNAKPSQDLYNTEENTLKPTVRDNPLIKEMSKHYKD